MNNINQRVYLTIDCGREIKYISFKSLKDLDSFTMLFHNYIELLKALNTELKLGLDIYHMSYDCISVDYINDNGRNSELAIRLIDDEYDDDSLKDLLYKFLLNIDDPFKVLKQNGINIEKYFLGHGVMSYSVNNIDSFLRAGVHRFLKNDDAENIKKVLELLSDYSFLNVDRLKNTYSLEDKLVIFLRNYPYAFKKLEQNGINIEDSFIGLGVSENHNLNDNTGIEYFLKSGINNYFNSIGYKRKRCLFFVLSSYGYNARKKFDDNVKFSSSRLSSEKLDELSKICDLRTLNGDLTVSSFGIQNSEIREYISSIIGESDNNTIFDGFPTLNEEECLSRDEIRKKLIKSMGYANITEARESVIKRANLVKSRDCYGEN